MATVQDVLLAIEAIAPERYAFGFDSVGLQLGDPRAAVSRAVVSLDRSLGAVAAVVEQGAQLLVSHHPLFFDPLPRLTPSDHRGRTAIAMVENRIACISAHTNWDCAIGGVNDELAKRLGLTKVRGFGSAAGVPMRKVAVMVPAAHVAEVLRAATQAGAGVIGNYESCSFQVEGTGTFLPREGANPAIGTVGQFEQVTEIRVEVTCREELRRSVVSAVRQAHPYEEPAIDFYVLDDLAEQCAGRIGELDNEMSLGEFVLHCDASLSTRAWTWGDPDARIRRVALIGGAADGEWRDALAVGADVYLTGEARQHVALEAVESGMPLIAAGHYATEHPGVEALAAALGQELPSIQWHVFAPNEGLHGRPF